jgi:hypothetical protein
MSADEKEITSTVEIVWEDKPPATALARWKRWRARTPIGTH